MEQAKGSGRADLALAESLEERGGFYEGRREFDDAEPLYKRALESTRGHSRSKEKSFLRTTPTLPNHFPG